MPGSGGGSGRRRGCITIAICDTLDTVEMLTLAAAVRAPGRMEPGRGDHRLQQAVRRLADYLVNSGRIPAAAVRDPAVLDVRPPEWRPPVDAGHFLRQLARFDGHVQPRVLTTIDAALQRDVQEHPRSDPGRHR